MKPSDAPARSGRDISIPKGVLVAVALLLLFTIGLAATARLTGRNHVTMPPTRAVASCDLTFTDRNDGGVEIADATTGRHVATVAPTTGGFLRGIMRGLVREHRLNDLSAGSAFRLTRWADGRLSIEDPGTRESFELEAFGPTNEAVFAQLLTDDPAGGHAETRASATMDGKTTASTRVTTADAGGATTR